jgi:hypothetical protein
VPPTLKFLIDCILREFVLRIIAITLAAASALALSTAAFAADQGQKADAKGSTAKPDDSSRIICKGGAMGDPDTGTRLPPKKVCHTKGEWDEMAALARQQMDSNATHMQGTPGGGSGPH